MRCYRKSVEFYCSSEGYLSKAFRAIEQVEKCHSWLQELGRFNISCHDVVITSFSIIDIFVSAQRTEKISEGLRCVFYKPLLTLDLPCDTPGAFPKWQLCFLFFT